jgi:hypothetical protein
MTDMVLARIAVLKLMPIPQLKEQWRDLFETQPPPYNRRFLEHRLAYRIQFHTVVDSVLNSVGQEVRRQTAK